MKYYKLFEDLKNEDFYDWFGDSKIVDSNGEPLVVFHQTTKTAFSKIKEEGFRKDKGLSILSDATVPNGYFFKPTKENINVGGDNSGEYQIEAYLKIENPLIVENRKGLVLFMYKNCPKYHDSYSKIEELDNHYKGVIKKLEDKYMEDQNIDHIHQVKKIIKEEWQPTIKEVAAKCREIIENCLEKNRYDGVIMLNDEGSFGRKTKTYIVLDRKNIRIKK